MSCLANDQARAAPFDAEWRAEWGQAAKLGCLLSFGLVLLFMIHDLMGSPEHAPLFVAMRFASVLITALVLWLLHTPIGARSPRALTVVMACNIGLLVDFIAVYTGGGSSPRYAGLMLLIFGGSVLMPWRPVEGATAALGVIAAYASLTVLTGRVGSWPDFAGQLFYLGATAVIANIGTIFRDRLRRREIESRFALVDALAHQSDFTAKMSHEIRTPLNVMVGYADILLDETLERDGAEARRLVQQIRGNGVKLRTLISDLLDFSKAQAGQMKVYPEPVGLAEVLEEIHDTFRPLTDKKGLELVAVCPPALPPVVTDRQRLCQILTNLMSNAVKFTDRGAITIEATGASALDAATRDALTPLADRRSGARPADVRPEVVIVVRDTGIGIRPPDLARLAADYQQVDGRKYGGTGLGLSISKKLAQVLGGRLAVASRWEEGTTFALFLPAASALRAAA